MLFRNLLFIVVVLCGLIALGTSLFPPPLPPHAPNFDPAPFQADDFRAVVEKVNQEIGADCRQLDLELAPPASDLAVARRLSLALTGTVPSLQEIRQFEAQPSEQRLPWWLAGILQDRRYADYFAERLARAYVGTENGPFVVYRRRRFVSWLSDELMQARPYDQVVRSLIDTEGLWTDRPATNFVSVTLEPDNKKGPNPERLAGRVTRAFLGIRLDCAQCHNHPFQKWTQHDFQGLAAFFAQVHVGFTGIYDSEFHPPKEGNKQPPERAEYEVEDRKTGTHKVVEPDVPFLKELLPATGSRRQRLAAWVTHPQNPYFARSTANRVWALLFGRPLVDPVDDLASQGQTPAVLQILADDFAAHQYDLRRLFQVIAATDAFRRDSAAAHEITQKHEEYWAAFPMARLRPEQVAGSLVQAASLETVDQDSHIVVQLVRFFNEVDFVRRYGDTGEDEFDGRGGTIPQRLLLMNGQLVKERTQGNPLLFTAPARIAALAPDDKTAVETAYLAVLTRRPTPEEAAHFEQRLAGAQRQERTQRLEDLYWTLVNSTEFSWNH
jgi:Protein of unknown function (DUF1549)/Protein of unknown function (DUF1553)